MVLMRVKSQMVRPWSAAFIVLSLLVLGKSLAFCAEARLEWGAPSSNADGNELNDLAGYYLYYGTESRQYFRKIDIGNARSYHLLDLVNGQRYFFALTAYDFYNNESSFSNEANLATPQAKQFNPLDFDGDGILDEFDDDQDNDGLTNSEELLHGTNPRLYDSDRDGVSDSQELLDGSNPLDPGSALVRLGNTVCAEWNGFLGGMWNVFEHVNLGTVNAPIESTIYNNWGQEQNVLRYTIPPRGQFDALVHESPGRAINAYGRICSRHFGVRDLLDGRMVYYKLDDSNSNSFDFVLTMPLTSGRVGPQFVPFNNHHPSLANSEAGNAAANWLQLSNLSAEEQSGWLVAFDMVGNELSRELVSIAARGRIDYPAHSLRGRQSAFDMGLIAWIPQTDSAKFTLRNVRYYYDNPYMENSFDGAVSVDASLGSGEDLFVPVDTVGRTSTIEIANLGDQLIGVDLEITTDRKANQSFMLEAKSSRHVVLDSILGPSKIGFVKLRGVSLTGTTPVRLAVWAMQYSRRGDGGINHAYGIEAKPLLGRVLQGSYNTYLEQVPWLVVVSPVAQTIDFTLTRQDGTEVGHWSEEIAGVRAFDIGKIEASDQYGVVRIEPKTSNSTQAWVMRVRGDQFVLPTAVR